MIGSDAIKLAIAGGFIVLTAILALRADRARPVVSPSPVHDKPDPSAVAPARAAGPTGRPRILTGEPAAPEQRKPASMRALKLLAGITTLAIAGAFGLLALVRALIAMFERIGD